MIDQNKKEQLARRLEQSMMTPSISRHFPKKTSQSCGVQLKANRLARCLVKADAVANKKPPASQGAFEFG